MEKKWDVFISHSSEDKDTLVRELANMLDNLGVKVWYDEFSLKVGDSLTQKIDEGLIDSNFGIVIISNAFLNKKWTDYEYRSLLSKEDNFKKVILPIWHNITHAEVKSFSLYLADKFALDTTKVNLQEIAKKLLEIIRPDLHENLSRLLLYKKLLSEAKSEFVKISDLKWGEKKRENLSPGQVNRIKGYFYSIGQLFGTDIENTLNCYLYDTNPEREIQTWEIMNVTFIEYVKQEKITDLNLKKEVAKQIVLISMGTLSEKTKLSVEQLTRLYEIWKENFYSF
ncbi:MAG: toll/interleukin-1 receptor domain-containing protein [Bacteroidota bacterium]